MLWSVAGSMAGGYIGARMDGDSIAEAGAYGILSGGVQLALGKINLSVDLPRPKTLLDNVSNMSVNWILRYTENTIGFTANLSYEFGWQKGVKNYWLKKAN